ncbi:MAG TPA: hypothetical protein VGM92_05375 [Candidatus Kapabacteria bacterium]|jgi:hypothetical protein
MLTRLTVLLSLLFIISIAALTHVAYAQTQKLPKTKLAFDLPGADWSLADSMKTKTGMRIYSYKRAPITDSEGRNIIPNIACLIEKVPKETDIVEYSAEKRGQVPFDVKEVYSSLDSNAVIHHPYAVAYKGTYTRDDLEHTVYVVHLIDENWGVQIICDATTEVFPICQPEFLKFLRSIRSSAKSNRTMEQHTVEEK